MLDFLDELATYLQGQSVGTAATDIFVNKLPPEPDNVIALLGLTGSNTGQARDVPGLQFPRFQVLVRNEAYNDAADTLQAVRAALHGMIGVILPVGVDTETDPYIRVLRCHFEQEGGPIGEDAHGRSEFSINFLAEYHHYDPT